MNSSILRKTFDQILRTTVVPATMPLEAKEQTYGQWTEFLANNIPTKLFRYRNYSTRSIEAFYHDQVWVTIGSKMNDGFDTRIYFGLKDSEKAIRDEFSDERLIQLYNLIIKENCPFQAFLKQYLFNAGYIWFREALLFQRPQAVDTPVQNPAEILRSGKQVLQSPILLVFLKVTIEGDGLNAPRGEQGQIGDLRQVVRVDEHLELWPVLETVLMKEPRDDGVVAREGFHQCRRQRQLLIWFGDVHEPRAVQPGYILTGCVAIQLELGTYGLRPGCPSIITHEPEESLHSSSFPIACGSSIEDEQALVARAACERVAQRLL